MEGTELVLVLIEVEEEVTIVEVAHEVSLD